MIHKTAVVHKKAKLGRGVKIGPYAVIGEHVKIGPNTEIGPHCVIDGWTAIGKDCRVFPGAVIGSISQDLKFKGDRSFVKIGNNNTIREYVTINRGTDKDSVTEVGDNNLLMAYCHIAHDCKIGNKVIIANCGTLAGHVTVEDSAIIGGLVGIHQFARVGTMSIIGGCSKIIRYVPPYAMADGRPTKVYGLNVIGLNRNGASDKTRLYLKQAFKLLFNSGLSLPNALKKVKSTIPQIKEVQTLARFLEKTKKDTKKGARR
ncbi:MAG: acyl-ACP--UDP-N-acetylglucosamine O-acyltransferase [Candidatus Omnitrophota bacterium]